MSNARNLARLVVDGNGDVAAASLDNVPPSNDASALTTGTLPIARIGDGAITAAKLQESYLTGIADGSVTAAKLASTLNLTGKTVTLPAGVGGKVLQVVSFNTGAQGSVTFFTTDAALSPDITRSITPVATGSSFLIHVRWFGEGSDSWNAIFNIHRNGSRVNAPGGNSWQGLTHRFVSFPLGDNNDSTPEGFSFSLLDTTGSTAGTAITYRLVVCGSDSSSRTLFTNRCVGSSGGTNYESGSSEIIITEIGA